MLCCFSMLLIFPAVVQNANILVLNPTNGQSHVNFLGNIADILATDDHNVTILSYNVDDTVKPFGSNHKNVTKLHHVSPYADQTIFENFEFKTEAFWRSPLPVGQVIEFRHYEAVTESYRRCFKGILEDKQLLQSLTDTKFDLGISETWELASVGLMHALGVKTFMLASAMGIMDVPRESIGLPIFSSLVIGWATTFSEDMTFLERVENFKFYWNMRFINWWFKREMQQLFEIHYPGFADLYEIAINKTGVALTNTNEYTETARPTTILNQLVGGANVYPPKKLSKTFDDLLNLRKGTVLFSFGTFAKICYMPKELKQAILDAFAHFRDYTFLLKYDPCENDTITLDGYDNIVPLTWMPQSDLLGDDRVSLFITHGGMNSLTETGFRGKAILAIPLFGDQIVNAKNVATRGVGIVMDRTKITVQSLIENISALLEENSTYRTNALKMAELLTGKDEEYRQAIQLWARKLAKYGRLEHLIPKIHDLNFIQLHSLDCVAFLILVYGSFFVGSYFILKLCWIFLLSRDTFAKKNV